MSGDKSLTKVKQEYERRTPKSRKMYEEAQHFLPGGVTRFTNFYEPYPLTVTSGEGCYVVDADGHRYIDYVCNYGSLIHGYTRAEIIEVVQNRLRHGTAIAASIPEHLHLAEMLCSRIPSAEMVRFCNSGTEATMFALRAARAYTGKTGFIKTQGGYHGLHDAVEFSDTRNGRGAQPNSAGMSKGAATEVFVVPFNDLESVSDVLRTHSNVVGTIMVEPVMAAAGMILPKPNYLEGLRRLADQYGCVLVFDEIQTLRMSTGGAQQLYSVTPDLTAVAKIIGGGFPVGAVCGKRAVMRTFDPRSDNVVKHGGTFSGNNISLLAGMKALELLDAHAIERLNRLASRLEAGIVDAFKDLDHPACVTTAGSMLHVHFVENQPTEYVAPSATAAKLSTVQHLALLNNGIFISPRGTIYVSTAMDDDVIDHTIGVFHAVVSDMNETLRA
ncbi:aspartate aminotransferase family protein [Burkholderia ubonensis]|uniref:aspartate aminotransferase family protein n=1 Tax=Burkholderia ubonensis TaxID=101571 RepID=UPI0007C67EAA|nr:aspartate aminotransferase family protein [Burkholderia ubonensis]